MPIRPIAFLCAYAALRIARHSTVGFHTRKRDLLEQRKHDRIRVDYLASFSAERFRAQGIILDLSVAGCRARSDSAIAVKKDDWLGVLIDVPRFESPLYVNRAMVRWVKAQEFGMEFIQTEMVDQQRLREVVESEILETRRTEHGEARDGH